MVRSLLLGVANAALFSGVALAQGKVTNDQVQAHDVSAASDVSVQHAGDASSSAVAGANTANAATQRQSMTVANQQTASGATRADATLGFGNVTGSAQSSAYGYGSGFTMTAVDGDATVQSAQAASGVVSARAESSGYLNGPNAVGAAGATAAGNVANIRADHGAIAADLHQDATGTVDAQARGVFTACCGSASAAAIASANTLTTSGTTSTHLADTRQSSAGAKVSASADLFVDNAAANVVAASTANGNAATFANEWGYQQVNAQQNNASEIEATAWATGGDWNAGSASAYGVGNTASASNIGSDTRLSFDQDNSGAVHGWSALSASGGVGVATATAIGNATSGFLCTSCGSGVLTAGNRQTNSGGVDAVSRVTMPAAGAAIGAANAFGNTATFEAGSPGG